MGQVLHLASAAQLKNGEIPSKTRENHAFLLSISIRMAPASLHLLTFALPGGTR